MCNIILKLFEQEHIQVWIENFQREAEHYQEQPDLVNKRAHSGEWKHLDNNKIQLIKTSVSFYLRFDWAYRIMHNNINK